MPSHKSAIKRARQNIKRNERNTPVRSAVRTAIKKVHSAITAGEKDKAGVALKSAISALDGSVTKGVHHAKNAARRVSRLTRQVDGMS